MKTATIIGHYGFNCEYYDGQTVKTKILTKELEKRFGYDSIDKIDTHGGIKAFLKAPFNIMRAIKKSKNVIILPGQNGVKVYAPLLRLLNRKKVTKAHYVVIGGWLPELLKKSRYLIKDMKSFSAVYVETHVMMEKLKDLGLHNVFVMPNCKELTILHEDELVLSEKEPYKLCTFSRVMKEKGIEDAVEAVIAVNNYFNRTVVMLDIFGQVDVNQQKWFEELKKSFPAFVNYKGVVPFEQSVEVLKNYYALLFPTHYDGEGFAGTLIDAMAAGLPVIASDWKYNPEIVHEGETGFLYSTFDKYEFIEKIIWAVNNPTAFNQIKLKCVKKAVEYQPTNVINVLAEKMIL